MAPRTEELMRVSGKDLEGEGARQQGGGRGPVSRYRKAWNAESLSHRLALLALFVMGVVLRAVYLFEPIRYDESFTFLAYGSRPLRQGLSVYSAPNNHLLHTLLVHGSTRVFGTDPWAIRLPAFIAGILLIPLTYLAVRKLFNKGAALLATALVVPSALLIHYSVDARGYGIQAAVFLALILVSIYLKSSDRPAGWVAFTILAVTGFYTVPTTLYFFGALVIWLALSALLGDTGGGGGEVRRNGGTGGSPLPFIVKLGVSCCAAALLTFLLYYPVIRKSGLHSLVNNSFVQPLNFDDFIHGLPGYLRGVWVALNAGIPSVVAVLLAAGFLLSLGFYSRISRHRVNLALVVLAWCAVLVFAQRVHPFERVWTPLLPLYFGFCAAGLCYAGSRAWEFLSERRGWRLKWGSLPDFLVVLFSICLGALVVITAIAVPDASFVYEPLKTDNMVDAENMVAKIKDRLQPGDSIYAGFAVPQVSYYLYKNNLPINYVNDNPTLSRDVLWAGDRPKAPPGNAYLFVDQQAGYRLSDLVRDPDYVRAQAVVIPVGRSKIYVISEEEHTRTK